MCVKPKGMTKLSITHGYLNGKQLCLINKWSNLGINLQTDWYDDADIKTQTRAMHIWGNMLVQKIKHCSVGVKTTLFTSYYSNSQHSSLWCNYRKETYRKCIVAYNDIDHKLFVIKRGDRISTAFVTNGDFLTS